MTDLSGQARGLTSLSLMGNRPIICAAVMIATLMQVADTTIANVALPHMQGGFAVTQDQITWVLTSYIVALAITTPLTGWVAGRIGRKRIFLLSVVGFTVASALCGAAQSLPQMVLFRLLQGMCGAALVPLSQAVLLDTFPGKQRGPAMALWGMGIMLGPILGPTLGGYLTENFDWRWVFYINLPLGVLAWLGIVVSVSETAINRARRFDFFGFTTLSLAIACLQLSLDRGEIRDWFSSTEIVVEAALVGLGTYCFLVHSATSKDTLIDRRILRDRNFVTALVFGFVIGIVLTASIALLAPMLQTLMDYPVMTTGLILAPRGIGTMATMLLAGWLVRTVDARLLILIGMSITAYSLWQMTERFSLQMDAWTVVWPGLVQGVGLGFIIPGLQTLAFSTISPQLRNEAAGITNLARNLGSSIGVSVVTAALAKNTQILHEQLAGYVTPYNPAFRLPEISRVWDLQTSTGLAAINEEITRQAMLVAYCDDFKMMMVVTLAAIPLIGLMRNTQLPPARG